VLDLKVGMVVSCAELHPGIREITEDYLLNVSPFLLKLLTEYIRSDPDRSWLAIADRNRSALEAALDGSGAKVLDERAARSIAWVELSEGVDSDEFCRWASENGVAMCPGGPFFWDRPEEGQGYIRIALLRPHSYFEEAARHLRQLMDSFVGAEYA
jgi:aspartate/methionine/tyrosine aminotransferase